MIFHITERASAGSGRRRRRRTPASTRGVELADEGFIHLQHRRRRWPGVVGAVLRRRRPTCVLLHVDESLLTAPLRYEAVGDDEFPHVYGALDLDAVVDVEPFTA